MTPPRPNRSTGSRSLAAAALSTLSVALAHAPENAAYGLLAFAPLGAAFGPTAMGLALLGCVIANLIASTFGDGRLVSGARASLSLLAAGLVGAVSTLATTDGAAPPALVLTLVALGVVCAGALQAVFGWLKFGRIVKYTPHPVRVGVTSGVGLLLIVTALPVITGHGFGSVLRSTFDAPLFGAVLVAVCALVVTRLAAHFIARVPPVLLGLGTAMALHFALGRWMPEIALGAVIGAPSLALHQFPAFDPAVLLRANFLNPALLSVIVSYAVTVAVLCSLDTLIVVTVVDSRLRHVRDANRELGGQGLANIATGLVTGQAFSPSMPRSLVLVARHPHHRHVVVFYALSMLALIVLVPQVVGQVPASAIGGVLLLQGFQMVAPAFWRAPLELWRRHVLGRTQADAGPTRAHLRGGDWAIELAVACTAVVFGLGHAVLIGATFAVLLFVRANMRDVVRGEWSGQSRRSLKARPKIPADALAREGSRIALLELEGALFFGTADGLRSRLIALAASVDTAILDLKQVTEIDVTAARILFETAEDWDRGGRCLVFSEWVAGDPRRRLIETAGPDTLRAALHFFDNADVALEEAEDRLLARLDLGNVPGDRLDLASTMLGRDLDRAELATLASHLSTLHFARGTILFRAGDPGDGLYVSLDGDIGLHGPGSSRRLASFAPGVVIGEMAVLARTTRSAEAVAESDVVAMKLSSDAFDRLMIEEPALAAKLLRNMSMHLADRVRTLTGDLSRWVARAAAGRGTNLPAEDPMIDPETSSIGH